MTFTFHDLNSHHGRSSIPQQIKFIFCYLQFFFDQLQKSDDKLSFLNNLIIKQLPEQTLFYFLIFFPVGLIVNSSLISYTCGILCNARFCEQCCMIDSTDTVCPWSFRTITVALSFSPSISSAMPSIVQSMTSGDGKNYSLNFFRTDPFSTDFNNLFGSGC